MSCKLWITVALQLALLSASHCPKMLRNKTTEVQRLETKLVYESVGQLCLSEFTEDGCAGSSSSPAGAGARLRHTAVPGAAAMAFPMPSGCLLPPVFLSHVLLKTITELQRG